MPLYLLTFGAFSFLQEESSRVVFYAFVVLQSNIRSYKFFWQCIMMQKYQEFKIWFCKYYDDKDFSFLFLFFFFLKWDNKKKLTQKINKASSKNREKKNTYVNVILAGLVVFWEPICIQPNSMVPAASSCFWSSKPTASFSAWKILKMRTKNGHKTNWPLTNYLLAHPS